MTIALPASTFRSSRTPWVVLAPTLVTAACGVAIMVSPDTPMLVRMLGGAVCGVGNRTSTGAVLFIQNLMPSTVVAS